MAEVEKRDDSGFFATVALVVFGVPLGILAVASLNGWTSTAYALH